jgi:hypothetical protein
VFNRKLMEEMASRAAIVIEWDTSHSPMLSQPELVVDLLDSIDADPPASTQRSATPDAAT